MDARKESRRWMMVTDLHMRARNSAVSMAVSPPIRGRVVVTVVVTVTATVTVTVTVTATVQEIIRYLPAPQSVYRGRTNRHMWHTTLHLHNTRNHVRTTVSVRVSVTFVEISGLPW